MGRHRLGPHVVGQRVVLRRLLTGERGPSGGPAFTDLLGVRLAWGDDAVLRLADGTEASVPVDQIVSGKPVPPRPSVRHRVSPEAQRLALAMWPQLDTAPLGAWTLRWSELSTTRRANSVLAMTRRPGSTTRSGGGGALRGLGRRPIAAVLPDSAEEEAFRARGWGLESGESDSLFQMASVAMARRVLRERPAYAVRLEEDGDQLVATVGADAGGLASLAGDWVGLRALEVAPARRRRGLGLPWSARCSTGGPSAAPPRRTSRCWPTTSRPRSLRPPGLHHPPHLPLPRSLTPRPNVCCVRTLPRAENGAERSERSS